MPQRKYNEDRQAVTHFLEEFVDPKAEKGFQFKYVNALRDAANLDTEVVDICIDDVMEVNPDLAEAIKANTKRYVSIFCSVVDELLPRFRTKNLTQNSVLDVYISNLLRNDDNAMDTTVTGNNQVTNNRLPPELTRRYQLNFVPSSNDKPRAVRDVHSSEIGHYVTIKGVVTRVSDVKPMMSVATYTCDQCGGDSYQVVNSPSFMPLLVCPSQVCATSGRKGRLHLESRVSRMIKFQEVKLQEHCDQVPMGSIPKSLSILTFGTNTRQAQPGDHVLVGGVFLPILKSGPRFGSGGLVTDTLIEAHVVRQVFKSDDQDDTVLDRETLEKLAPNAYERLSSSIAPEIFGHVDVKKALLLLLVGGTERSVKGMKVRGNIHVCLMGDPGVAKSQLLSYVDRLSVRSQYTTGRGSSGVGLTAAVVKDPLTNEMILEGGALVLADRGVCCIDEFDKMQESDRTAIHEVMEQQTISIAKAGIMTTLNARTSILAAANPAYGRYNPRKTVEQNINLPAALLSRFDLLWLLTDKADRDMDVRLAKHVTYVHRHQTQPPQKIKSLDMSTVRQFVALAQQKEPVIPVDLTDYIGGAYVQLRREARNSRDSTFTSPRTLLSVCRLATALARLRLADLVQRVDVDEALRLMEASKESLLATKGALLAAGNRVVDTRAKIFHDIKDAALALGDGTSAVLSGSTLKIADVTEALLAKGFPQADIDATLAEYEELNVWAVSSDQSKLIFI